MDHLIGCFDDLFVELEMTVFWMSCVIAEAFVSHLRFAVGLQNALRGKKIFWASF
jgi:hypothetical protein